MNITNFTQISGYNRGYYNNGYYNGFFNYGGLMNRGGLPTTAIQNIYNIGGTSACGSGPTYCPEGYGLYFPCLKNITRGQNVCFDFYVTDTSTQDVADMRDIEEMALTLNGLFGCTYGTYYYYPDVSDSDIVSLQHEEYPVIYSDDFDDDNVYTLTLIRLNNDESDLSDVNTVTGLFYNGTEVTVEANDTEDYIFIGWANSTADDDEYCEDDFIISIEHQYKLIIDDNKTLFAIYRPRTDKDGLWGGNTTDIDILTESVPDDEYPYDGNEFTSEVKNITLKFEKGNGYLKFEKGNGYLKFEKGSRLVISSMGLTDGIKINLYARTETPCNVTVSLNGAEASQEISDPKIYSYLFRDCDESDITIESDGEFLLDIFEICNEKIIDKGKAELCLDSSDTALLATGPLSVTGAIRNVLGNIYGINKTQIGNVNRLSKINIF